MAAQPAGALHLSGQLQAGLAQKSLHPSPTWLSRFLATQRPNMPPQALLSTASFRLLASDIRTTLSAAPNRILPGDVQDVHIKERTLPAGEVVIQIIDVEDLGLSRWSQIEAIDADARGESMRGREIIRVPVAELNEAGDLGRGGLPATGAGGHAGAAARGAAGSTQKSGPHKVLMQDAKGVMVYGFEMETIEGIHVGMGIGAKMVLKGCTAARGMVLLEPVTVVYLGGKVEALHTAWVKGRKERLEALIEAGSKEDVDMEE